MPFLYFWGKKSIDLKQIILRSLFNKSSSKNLFYSKNFRFFYVLIYCSAYFFLFFWKFYEFSRVFLISYRFPVVCLPLWPFGPKLELNIKSLYKSNPELSFFASYQIYAFIVYTILSIYDFKFFSKLIFYFVETFSKVFTTFSRIPLYFDFLSLNY